MLKRCEYCRQEFKGTAKKKFCTVRCRTFNYRDKNNIPIHPFLPKIEEEKGGIKKLWGFLK